MVEGRVALVERPEGVRLEVWRPARLDSRVPQRRRVGTRRVHIDERIQVAMIEGRREPESRLLWQVERVPYLGHPGERALHFEPRGRALRTVFDRLREVIPVHPLHVEIRKPGDAHLVHRQVFRQEEVAAQPHQWPEPHERARPPGHGQQPRERVGQAHQVVERFPPSRQVERTAR